MTKSNNTSLRIAAALSLLVATAALAEPGPDSIMLEQIGAVRMATPDEVRQQQGTARPRDYRALQQNNRQQGS